MWSAPVVNIAAEWSWSNWTFQSDGDVHKNGIYIKWRESTFGILRNRPNEGAWSSSVSHLRNVIFKFYPWWKQVTKRKPEACRKLPTPFSSYSDPLIIDLCLHQTCMHDITKITQSCPTSFLKYPSLSSSFSWYKKYPTNMILNARGTPKFQINPHQILHSKTSHFLTICPNIKKK